MKKFYEVLEFLPLILVFAAWVAMVMSFFLNFEIPILNGKLS